MKSHHIILGFYEGHNASATVMQDGKVIAAIEEERFSRNKNHDGRPAGCFPETCVDQSLKTANVSLKDIGSIAVPLRHPKNAIPFYLEFMGDLLKERNWKRLRYLFRNKIGHMSWKHWYPKVSSQLPQFWNDLEAVIPSTLFRTLTWALFPVLYNFKRIDRIETFFSERGFTGKFEFFDHHHAHAASAYYTQPKRKDILVVTHDGMGDGTCGCVYTARDGHLVPVEKLEYSHSFGQFYFLITSLLGMIGGRHEGKVTGLAAFGKPVCRVLTEACRQSKSDTFHFSFFNHDQWGIYPGKELWFAVLLPALKTLSGLLMQYRPQDIAASAQNCLEKAFVPWIDRRLSRYGASHLCLAGGLFANVSLNAKLLHQTAAESLYVHPAMNDGGLSLGAALLSSRRRMHKFAHIDLQGCYLGTAYCDGDMVAALARAGECIQFRRITDPVSVTADLLAQKKVVAVFQGRFEYGPRALGNRSILVHAGDPTVNQWLNKQLNRTEYMPFAPAVMGEFSRDMFTDLSGAELAAKYMTVALQCTSRMKAVAPASIHVDGTARPQILYPGSNSFLRRVLACYYEKTGTPCCINTSFNRHGEPIVATPEQAIEAFIESNLDCMVMGPYLVRPSQPDFTPVFGDEEHAITSALDTLSKLPLRAYSELIPYILEHGRTSRIDHAIAQIVEAIKAL